MALLVITAMAPFPADAQTQTQQQVFDAAKAYGASSAATTAAAVRDGSAENATVRRTVPYYTASPQQAQSYGNKDAAAQAAQQQAACQLTPNDPTCSAGRVATQARPASTVTAADPALAGAAAGANPTAVLGDIANTYNACSVGGGMTAPATYARQACTLETMPWSDQACRKTLDVSPVQTTSCPAGTVIASQQLNGAGPMSVQAYCNPASGSRVRITASAIGIRGACTGPIDTVVDLSRPQPLGANPPTRIGDLQPNWMGSCFPLSVFWEGQGCQLGQCAVTVHFVEGAGEIGRAHV